MPIKVSVGFSTSRKLVSRIIRRVTRSKVSHTWLLVSDSFLGVDMVMQATLGGFQMTSYEAFKKHHQIITLLEPNHSLSTGVKQSAQWLGFRYDYAGLFGAAFVIMGRWFRKKWGNPFNDADALFCSEAVVRVLQASGYPGAEVLDASTVTPQDLLAFLTPNPLPAEA